LKGAVYRNRNKVPIEQRPSHIELLQELGHWEGDTVELGRGGVHLVTLVERKNRFLLTTMVPNKQSDTVQQAIEEQVIKFPKDVRSLILDNGSEFAKHPDMAANLSQISTLRIHIAPGKVGPTKIPMACFASALPKKSSVCIHRSLSATYLLSKYQHSS